MKTKAAVVYARGGKFQFEEVCLDEPRDDQMVVRIVACGICHSDIAVRDGLFAAHFPRVLGHEGAGVVERVGKKIKRVRPGDHVVLSFGSCGKCASCKSMRPAQCRAFDKINFGWSPTLHDARGAPLGGNFFGQSSFAYYALTHERNAVVVDAKEEELALFAPLGCGIQAGAGTVLHELKPRKGSSLLVLGAGAVGLAAVMAGHLRHAHIVVADIVPSRLKLAHALGAHRTIDCNKESLDKHFKEVSLIVDTTGHSAVINQAIALLSPRGKISLMAVAADDGEIATLGPHQRLIESCAGDSNPQNFIPFLIRRYRQGKFPFDKLIRYYPASKINQAVADSLNGRTVKPVLLFASRRVR